MPLSLCRIVTTCGAVGLFSSTTRFAGVAGVTSLRGCGAGVGVCAEIGAQMRLVSTRVGNTIANALTLVGVLIAAKIFLAIPCRATFNYQEPLTGTIKGDGFCEIVLSDPKLTVGTDIVRELPRPSSTETFSD